MTHEMTKPSNDNAQQILSKLPNLEGMTKDRFGFWNCLYATKVYNTNSSQIFNVKLL
jgi:hypothetical protein